VIALELDRTFARACGRRCSREGLDLAAKPMVAPGVPRRLWQRFDKPTDGRRRERCGRAQPICRPIVERAGQRHEKGVPHHDRVGAIEILVVQETRGTRGPPRAGAIGLTGHVAHAARSSFAQGIPRAPRGRLDRRAERGEQLPMLELDRRRHDRRDRPFPGGTADGETRLARRMFKRECDHALGSIRAMAAC